MVHGKSSNSQLMTHVLGAGFPADADMVHSEAAELSSTNLEFR